jgi:putative DNA primase/helicase
MDHGRVENVVFESFRGLNDDDRTRGVGKGFAYVDSLTSDEIETVRRERANDGPNDEDELRAEVRTQSIARGVTGYEPNDSGNAKRLVTLHGETFRYRSEGRSGHWHVWTGTHWGIDRGGDIQEAAKSVPLAIYAEAAKGGEGSERLAKWGLRSGDRTRVASMIELARSDRRIRVTRDDFDADPWSLNVQNGVVDLRTGATRPHAPQDGTFERDGEGVPRMHSQIAAAAYRSDAEAPRWRAFIETVLPDADVRDYVQRLVGYSASGHMKNDVFPFVHGPGGNGKTVFLESIAYVLGDYSHVAGDELLASRQNGVHPQAVMALRGHRFVVTSEVEGEGVKINTRQLKTITGDEWLTARAMHQSEEQFRNVTHLWMAANDLPSLNGLDPAIWRRVRLIPFTVTIPTEAKNANLTAELREEADGILAWVIEGALKYQRHGLNDVPEAVRLAGAEFQERSNPLLDWFESSEFELHDGGTASAAELRASYERWHSARRGEPKVPRSAKWTEALTLLGLSQPPSKKVTVDGVQVTGWTGVRRKSKGRGDVLDL